MSLKVHFTATQRTIEQAIEQLKICRSRASARKVGATIEHLDSIITLLAVRKSQNDHVDEELWPAWVRENEPGFPKRCDVTTNLNTRCRLDRGHAGWHESEDRETVWGPLRMCTSTSPSGHDCRLFKNHVGPHKWFDVHGQPKVQWTDKGADEWPDRGDISFFPWCESISADGHQCGHWIGHKGNHQAHIGGMTRIWTTEQQRKFCGHRSGDGYICESDASHLDRHRRTTKDGVRTWRGMHGEHSELHPYTYGCDEQRTVFCNDRDPDLAFSPCYLLRGHKGNHEGLYFKFSSARQWLNYIKPIEEYEVSG